MKLARYVEGGRVEIVDEAMPQLPKGGLIVKTEASGLCSGELMAWYMERKMPHVLGHEVAGIVVESDAAEFPVGSRVYAHHHAPCLACEECKRGHYVHCATWKRTKLDPGGMAEYFAVAPELLTDTLILDGVSARDGALIEPLACVMKAIRRSGWHSGQSAAVIGLGFMGLLHLVALRGKGAGSLVGYDLHPGRRDYGASLGFDAQGIEKPQPADVIFVCPGTQPALDLAISIVRPGGTVVLFSPFAPTVTATFDLNRLYFQDARLITSYSAGPDDSQEALEFLAEGKVKAEQVVSDFITMDDLPEAYQKMKAAEILKPMVLF